MSTFLKYVLSMIDNYMEGRWEHKGVYVFYLELVTDMLHLLVYLVFFVIVFTNYGLPLHLVSHAGCYTYLEDKLQHASGGTLANACS